MARLREMVEGAGGRLEPGWGVEARARPVRAHAACARSAPARAVRAGQRARARQVKQRSNGTRAGSADAYYTSPGGDIFRRAARPRSPTVILGRWRSQGAVSCLAASGARQCRGCEAALQGRQGRCGEGRDSSARLRGSGIAHRPVRAAQRCGAERAAGRAGRARRWRARWAWRPSTRAATARAIRPRRAWTSTWPKRTSRRCCSTWPYLRPSAPRGPPACVAARVRLKGLTLQL
jgi:hypothetical protein